MGRHRIIAILHYHEYDKSPPIYVLFLCVAITCLDIPLYLFPNKSFTSIVFVEMLSKEKNSLKKFTSEAFPFKLSRPKTIQSVLPLLFWINFMIPSRLWIHIEQWTLLAGNGETEYRGMSGDL